MNDPQTTVIAALELAAAFIAREDVVREAQEARGAGRVGHADPASVHAIVAAEERLARAGLDYRRAVAGRQANG